MDRKEEVALESDSLFLKTSCHNFQELFIYYAQSGRSWYMIKRTSYFVFENSVKRFQSCKNKIKTSYSGVQNNKILYHDFLVTRGNV